MDYVSVAVGGVIGLLVSLLTWLITWYIDSWFKRRTARQLLCNHLGYLEKRLLEIRDLFTKWSGSMSSDEIYLKSWIPQFNLDLLLNLLREAMPKRREQVEAVFEVQDTLEALEYRVRRGDIDRQVLGLLQKNATRALGIVQKAKKLLS